MKDQIIYLLNYSMDFEGPFVVSPHKTFKGVIEAAIKHRELKRKEWLKYTRHEYNRYKRRCEIECLGSVGNLKQYRKLYKFNYMSRVENMVLQD